jgi:hypothetical protein
LGSRKFLLVLVFGKQLLPTLTQCFICLLLVAVAVVTELEVVVLVVY